MFRTRPQIFTNVRVDKQLVVKGDTTITGDLQVGGKVITSDVDRESIVKEVLDALPFGVLDNCHGCDKKSYGFMWEVSELNNTKDVERQMCLECLYQIMLIERVKQAEFQRSLNQ